MKVTLCTLFNSNYLDKGLALYQSLEEVCADFELYVLAMDDKCYEVLSDIGYKYLKPISLAEFETSELIEARGNRSFGEYCWTCSSSFIKYILDKYTPDHCTYIDADMYFYSDPAVLVQEMYEQNCTVLVTAHRFNWYENETTKKVGRFCVEFNTFANEERAKMLLNKWVEQCIEACYRGNDGIHYGDQMYIDKWCEDYDFVHETQNLGAGVAPWNIRQYKLISSANDRNIVVRCGRKNYRLVFYHFENIQYIEQKIVNIHVYKGWSIDKNLVDLLYLDYVQTTDRYKCVIRDKYSFLPLIKSHPVLMDKSNNAIKKIASAFSNPVKFAMTILPFKLFRKKNVVKL